MRVDEASVFFMSMRGRVIGSPWALGELQPNIQKLCKKIKLAPLNQIYLAVAENLNATVVADE